MTYSKEEILDALMVIVKTCKEQTSCFTCPFANSNGVCKITHNSPNEWYMIEKEPEIWRAFI